MARSWRESEGFDGAMEAESARLVGESTCRRLIGASSEMKSVGRCERNRHC